MGCQIYGPACEPDLRYGFLVKSCENESFPHFVCQFIADHIGEMFNGEICKLIVGCP